MKKIFFTSLLLLAIVSWVPPTLFAVDCSVYAPLDFEPTNDGQELAFLELINQYRAGLNDPNVKPLSIEKSANRASKWMAQHMASRNVLSHTDQFGNGPADRMVCFGDNRSNTWGENALDTYSTAQQAFNGWLGSPPHRDNMKDPRFTTIGIARVQGSKWYWVTAFGNLAKDPPIIPNRKPTISDQVRVNGSSAQDRVLPAGSEISLEVTVNDPDGLSDIKEVQFYNFSSQQFAIVPQASFSGNIARHTWTPPSNMPRTGYAMSARVIDKTNNITWTLNGQDVRFEVAQVPQTTAPSFTTHPASPSSPVPEGQSVTLTAIANGNPAPTYKWEISSDNFNWSDAGSTNTSITFTATTTKYYRCIATNSAGNATSHTATVTVTPKPPVNQRPTVTLTNNGSLTVAPGTVRLKIEAHDPDGDNTISVVELRNDGDELQQPALVNQGNGVYTYERSGMPEGRHTYKAIVKDQEFTVVSDPWVTITIAKPDAPTITTHPQPKTVTDGQSVTFNVVASGTGLSYQWQLKKTPNASFEDISGKTTDTLTFTADRNMNGYEYRCAVSNTGGTTPSNSATLTVNPKPNQPPTVSISADKLSATAPGLFVLTASASDADGSISKVEFFQGATKLGEDLTAPYTFNWNNVSAGTYSVTAKATDNQGAETISTAIQISVNAPLNRPPTISLASPTNNAEYIFKTADADVVIPMKVNASDPDGDDLTVTYQRVSDPAADLGTSTDKNNQFSFNWHSTQLGVMVVKATVTDGKGGSATSSNTTITIKPEAPSVASQPQNQSVQEGTSASFTFDVLGRGLTYKWQLQQNGTGNFVDIPNQTDKTITISNATLGMNKNAYRCVAQNGSGVLISNSAALTVLPAAGNRPPEIKEAASATPNNTPQKTIQLSVLASDADGDALTYTWSFAYYRVIGKTEDPNVTVTGSGRTISATFPEVANYKATVTVSDGRGGTVSSEVVVQIVPPAGETPPTISVNPKSQEIYQGQRATVSVSAKGNNLSYQWFVDGSRGDTEISGATSASYTSPIMTVQSNGTQLFCKVSNNSGSVSSTKATIIVKALPQLNDWKMPAELAANEHLKFNFPSGVGSTFRWTFTKVEDASSGSGAGALALNRIGSSPSLTTTTSDPDINPSTVSGISSGQWNVTVTGTDGSGTSLGSASGSIYITSAIGVAVNIRVFPNPWKAPRDNGRDVTIDGIPTGSSIKLFSLSGRFVRELPVSAGAAVWNRKNDSGDTVASGIYLYVVEDPSGNKHRGKVVLVQ